MTNIDAKPPTRPESHLVTVFGGSGFVGRQVVRDLAKRGYRIRVAVRRPDLALTLQPCGKVGQIVAVQANIRYPDSVRRAVANADIIVNLVGILQEVGGQTFSTVQADGANAVADAVAEVGARLVHVSALGADPGSNSAYARTKAEGEAAALRAVPDAVILRPSLMFGPGDGFFNRFAELARFLPVLPLVGGKTRFQPVFVGDVAEAVARAVDAHVEGGRIYELGGPEVATLEHLVRYMLDVTRRKRGVVDLPVPVARLQARALELVDMATFGLLPNALKLTRDQVTLLQSDNVVSDAAEAEGRTFAAFGISPTAAEAVAPSYLWTYRKAGQFAQPRGSEALEAVPETLEPDANAASEIRAAHGPAIGPDTTKPSRMGARWGTRA